MATISLSLDKVYTRKVEIVRDKHYPDMTVDEALREFVKLSLDKEVPENQ